MSVIKNTDEISYCFSGQEIYFNTKEKVPLSDLIDSLKGLEKIISQSRGMFSALFEVDIKSISVYVEKIEEGSLWKKIAVKLHFKDETDFDAFVERWCTKFREAGPMAKFGMYITAGLAALTLYGIYQAISSSSPSSTNVNVNITNSTINTIGAETYGKSPEEFQKIISDSIKDKKALAKNSVQFVEPARHAGGDVSFNAPGQTSESLTIDQGTISKTPDKVDFSPDEKSVAYDDVTIELRATDLDSYQKGWAAVIPGLVKRRVPMEISPSIDVSKLTLNGAIRADVDVEYRFDSRLSGDKYKPVKIVLKSIVS